MTMIWKENRMKIKVTEIECNAEELRQSNTMAEAFTNMLRRAFTPFTAYSSTDTESEDEDDGIN